MEWPPKLVNLTGFHIDWFETDGTKEGILSGHTAPLPAATERAKIVHIMARGSFHCNEKIHVAYSCKIKPAARPHEWRAAGQGLAASLILFTSLAGISPPTELVLLIIRIRPPRCARRSLDVDPNSRTVLASQPEVKGLGIATSLRIEQTLSCVHIFGKYVGETPVRPFPTVRFQEFQPSIRWRRWS